ncbi:MULTISPECIES: Sec-independent protein translocase subunit TatA/TatB [Larkinella]|jgi:sec-independent protein translocase protein TatA|uniref:Sec-independent protein translocase protein TatA n=4 Tax=Larkinella TaxID=332157 RepID=A0A5N1J7U2_9BACT|nr:MULTISPECIES: twin-arginine translocase TatA/TatE family subunit [Larkinella]KAA9347034.1 twin-arginine translocase TatA/TatE family subunit [Larkinella humicola]RCR67227.1 twin-arginine translocase TatA/TatE family subunit [Larkinella punicea]RRB00952.1 twin-arginine translocase TatA/TatE family subunit [Larkinella rosea]
MALLTIYAFLGSLGGTELLLIGLVILLFFGAKRIPDLMKGLGKGIKEFKDATKDVRENIEEGLRDTNVK